MTVNVLVTAREGDKTATRQIVVTESALRDVGFDFNPSADNRVFALKALSAALITEMQPIIATGGPAGRQAAIARTDIETAQMRAVKALFTK